MPDLRASLAHSIFDVFHQPLGTYLGPEHIARRIHRYSLCCTCSFHLLHRIRDQGRYNSISKLSDPNPSFPAVVILRYELRFSNSAT